MCSESFSYFDPGTGVKPQVKIGKSGDCPPGSDFQIGGPTIAPPVVPAIQRNAPRVIEASATSDMAPSVARRAVIERLAELIEAAPSS